MSKIKIVTDSTSDLSKEIIRKFNIEVIPLSVSIDGETYLDGVDISPSEFMEKMKEAKELPKSSQPAVGKFLELYDQLCLQGYDVISIHLSTGLSGTVGSAESAAQMSKCNVTVVDSKFISKALSFQVIEAAKMAENGSTVEEIISRLDEIQKHSHLYVVVDTLENLVKGGRIGRGKALIGSLLKIKPIASLTDGVYTPVANARSHAQVVSFLTEQFVKDSEGKKVKDIGIVHANGLELAKKLSDSIKKISGYVSIEVVDTTPIIGTHTGPGAIGFMYYAE